jgi:hypothetical protein
MEAGEKSKLKLYVVMQRSTEKYKKKILLIFCPINLSQFKPFK